MAALDTIADYLASSRGLLQDLIVPYRYSDADLVSYLNQGIQESRALRADLWLVYTSTSLPTYPDTPTSTVVDIDPMVRMAFVYYMCGRAQLTDMEETEDTRGLAFLAKFQNMLTSGKAVTA
jgi:hypothetical protein